jgi:S1-C subfamily serine protease
VNQTVGLKPVQIYNLTKASVVLVTNIRTDSTVAEGSGFVYDSNGHIITNNHVVDGHSSLTVTFQDGTALQANLIGVDVYSDLAVMKVDSLPSQANPLILSNSTELNVGEPVYAIGNPFRLSGSMTAGIVSQLGRVLRLSDLGVLAPWGNYSIVDVIQSDAAVNPGNSGGPLINSLGQVVGVTFAIETGGTSTGFIGIGYAVPSVLLQRVVPSLIMTGTYAHPWLGIEFTGMTPEQAARLHTNYAYGTLLLSVTAGGPADLAGLEADDIIIQVDDVNVTTSDVLPVYLERYKSPNDIITLKIIRNNVVLTKNLKLGTRPS